MNPIHFGDHSRLLSGFHHPALGSARKTPVLLCNSWGPEFMRGYRGVRAIAQRLSAAGFETLRFDYSGTGDSSGHSLDARLEHWLEDINLAARELKDLSGQNEIAVIGIRFGALLVEAARLRLGLRARLFVFWDCPANGLDHVALMQSLAEAADDAKRWRRQRDLQLPPPDSQELHGHAWPTTLAKAVDALAGPDTQGPKLWYTSLDEPPRGPTEAVLSSGEASHWQDVKWIHTPWVPVAAANRLAEHLAGKLP